MLLCELQHRMTNTMAMISAIVQSCRHKSVSPEAQQVLSDMAHRVRSIGAARSLPRGGDEPGQISGLQALVQADKTIKHHNQGRGWQLGLGTAIPLGLIINELALNSVKHAFNGRTGEIVIKVNLMNGERHAYRRRSRRRHKTGQVRLLRC